ncbi:MAG: hypothetical protein WCL18_09090 [bacterium]
MSEEVTSSKNNEQKNIMVGNIRMCMAAILLLIPTVQVQSGDALKIQQRESL